MAKRAPLLINCSKQEARKIRETAQRERRTISGYVFNVVVRAVRFAENLVRMRAVGAGVEEKLLLRLIDLYGLEGRVSQRPPGPRTTMLLWCSQVEARRIRKAAKRRETTISGFVLHTLRSFWSAAEALPPPPPRRPSKLKT